jgi:SagB-type dehydrogenase family enzyme
VNGRLRVRRSRHLVCHWAGGAPVIVNFATSVSIHANAVIVHVLTLCDDWRTVAEIAAALPSMPPRDARALVGALVDRTLLARSDRDEDPREAGLATWDSWNPAAGFFHFTTKNVPPPPDLERAEHELREEYAASGSPPRFKRYPRARTIALPPAAKGGAFTDVLLARRTWRSFSDEAITLDELSTLLGLTCGVQRTAEAVGLGTVHLTTSPSGGARHPLEAYVLAVRVDNLAPGLYHYASGEHVLERVSAGARAAAIRRYIPGQWWYESAAALFMLTAVFPRTQWRYKTPRAYRNVLLEAGHVVQTFCLTATWLGLAPFCTARFSDEVVESAIRADGVTESFVYGGGVGRRPPGRDWAPWPIEHAPAHPLRRVPRARVRSSSASR